ncbi:DUF5787 family protein [Natronorubrum daqingense]|uniref:Uncharacterized protein n=1 Tax=Natronorubrum daqingense TaxID=588898 RepID=A0A1N6YZ80_9EURY|nr:DUF5787 family protein [Natronorubrum daqingense]APX95515.1 hypothetical protein BB347_02180 [Natronorubrum daqingense]SIR19820.1 hypothetical protein SAMN05421809_0613 [Natronorubrum daqingense]
MNEETSEFAFELGVCHWAERNWPPAPTASDDAAALVARQLGTRGRRWDTIVLECDADALQRRANFGPKRLESDLLHVVRHAPEDWAYYRDCLPHPGYPWRYVREAIHQADDRGILETQRNGNRIEIRRKWVYPDWVERIVAVENKPDLDASAARVLGSQLEYDVAMALADEVWVGTHKTGERVEPALLEGLPVEAGILTLEEASSDAEVAWHPRTLAVDEPGTRILERPDGGRRDGSAARFEYVSPEEKAAKRLEIAERAYERGWRSFADTMRPDCRYFELRTRDGIGLRPHCTAKGGCQTATECSGRCPEFEPEPPTWRTNGWPIDGGPGARCRQVLEDRRRRRRPGLEP